MQQLKEFNKFTYCVLILINCCVILASGKVFQMSKFCSISYLWMMLDEAHTHTHTRIKREDFVVSSLKTSETAPLFGSGVVLKNQLSYTDFQYFIALGICLFVYLSGVEILFSCLINLRTKMKSTGSC